MIKRLSKTLEIHRYVRISRFIQRFAGALDKLPYCVLQVLGAGANFLYDSALVVREKTRKGLFSFTRVRISRVPAHPAWENRTPEHVSLSRVKQRGGAQSKPSDDEAQTRGRKA